MEEELTSPVLRIILIVTLAEGDYGPGTHVLHLLEVTLHLLFVGT